MVKRSFIALLLLVASSNVLACNPDQGTGQCGYRGANGAIYNSYGEAQSSFNQQGRTAYNPTPRIVKKPDSFAAMATSPKSGKIATATHYHSVDAANNGAIYKCQQATGEKCIVVHTFRNGCMTAISGTMRTGGARLFPESAHTGREAERKAMAACKKAVGIIDCLPVFEEPICSFS